MMGCVIKSSQRSGILRTVRVRMLHTAFSFCSSSFFLAAASRLRPGLSMCCSRNKTNSPSSIQRTRSADSSTMQEWPTPYHQAALGCQAPRLQKKTYSFFLFPSQLPVLQCISSAHSLQPKRRSTSPLLRHIWSGPLQAWRLQQCSDDVMARM